MAFADTVFALSGRSRWLLASQFDVNGFDHSLPLSRLNERPDLSVLEHALNYIRAYPHLNPTEPGQASSLLSLDPDRVRGFSQDLSLISRTLLKLAPDEIAILSSLLEITENEYHDQAVDLPDLITSLPVAAPRLKSEIEPLMSRYAPHPPAIDPLDGSGYLDGFEPSSIILASSSTAHSKRAGGIALNCTSSPLAYSWSLMGILFPDWSKFCSRLRGVSGLESLSNGVPEDSKSHPL
jgi:hypothetical protein